METLSTLKKFSETYPQFKEGNLSYAFTGGTAVRLCQEKTGFSKKREISDFDLIVFGDGKYPVHSFDKNQRLVPLDDEKIKSYVDKVRIKDKDYFFMGGSFLALSKTCAIDTPREKDYNDVKFLYDSNQIDRPSLESLFLSSEVLSNNSHLSMQVFDSLLSEHNPDNLRLFQSFRNYINLLDSFSSKDKVSDLIKSYVKNDKDKSGYAISNILYNSNFLVDQMKDLPERSRLKFLESAFVFASENDYIDFDRKVHGEILPKLKYSNSNKGDITFS